MTPPSVAELLARDPRVAQRKIPKGVRLLPHMFATSVVAVLDGALALEVSRSRRTAQIIEIVGPGAGVTHGRLLLGVPRMVVLLALKSSVVLSMSEASFDARVARDPELARQLAVEQSRHTADLRERIALRGEPAVHQKVANALVYLARRVGDQCPISRGQRLQLSQATIAALADLSRQTVNRALRDLQALGLLHIEHSVICLLDRGGLETIGRGDRLEQAWIPAEACKVLRPSVRLTCEPLRPAKARLTPLMRRAAGR